MKNIILMPYNKPAAELSIKLGFTETTFLDHIEVITALTKKNLLTAAERAQHQHKISLFKPETEELLRLALERSAVSIVFGLETIHSKDSLHYVRAGLDQVLCKLAVDNDKTIGFSFSALLHAADKPSILRRMAANVALCRKYHVKTIFSTFATSLDDLRGAKDLDAWVRIVEKL